jgi:hypothetical protein
MKRMLLVGVLAIAPLSAANAQFLGEGTGGYMARSSGPTGAMGGGHHEPMGFGLLATRSCWADAEVGCNAIPNPPSAQPAADETPAAPAASKPVKAAKRAKKQ